MHQVALAAGLLPPRKLSQWVHAGTGKHSKTVHGVPALASKHHQVCAGNTQGNEQVNCSSPAPVPLCLKSDLTCTPCSTIPSGAEFQTALIKGFWSTEAL